MSLGLGPISALPISAIQITSREEEGEKVSATIAGLGEPAPIMFQTGEDFPQPVAATPVFEESPGLVQPFIEDVIVQFETGEELPAQQTAALEEAGTIVAIFIEDAPVQFEPGEEFAGAHPTEESAVWQPLPQDQPWLATAQPTEEYIGRIAYEEVAPPTAVIVDPDPIFAAIGGDDFGGAHPVEESSPPPLVLDAGPWVTALTVTEEFIGYTLVEEGLVWVPTLLDDLLPAQATQGDEFGGSHPIEEAAAIVSVPEAPPWITVISPDEYVGNTLLEEGLAAPFIAPEIPFVQAASPGDEFGGAHPVEETAAPMFIALDESFIVVSGIEDVLVALPVEEQAVWMWPPVERPRVETRSIGDDFVASILFEEYGQPAIVADEPIVPVTIVVTEEAVQSFALDEAAVAAFVPREFIPVALALSPEEIGQPPAVTLVDEQPGLAPVFMAPALVPSWVLREEFVPKPIPPAPPFNGLLALGGDDTEDLAIIARHAYYGLDDETRAEVAWELGLEDYSRRVSFRDFEAKILAGQREEQKRDEFREMADTFHAEEMERLRVLKIVKTTIVVAGVAYVVKLVMWL